MSRVMGVTDEFALARELCRSELGFDIGGEASEFRMAISRAGQKRLKHCVTLVRLWARPGTAGVDKYERLLALLRLVTPEKVGKYRDPETEAGVGLQAALDAELGDVLRREK